MRIKKENINYQKFYEDLKSEFDSCSKNSVFYSDLISSKFEDINAVLSVVKSIFSVTYEKVYLRRDVNGIEKDFERILSDLKNIAKQLYYCNSYLEGICEELDIDFSSLLCDEEYTSEEQNNA